MPYTAGEIPFEESGITLKLKFPTTVKLALEMMRALKLKLLVTTFSYNDPLTRMGSLYNDVGESWAVEEDVLKRLIKRPELVLHEQKMGNQGGMYEHEVTIYTLK